jgi:acyl-CoA dehydrogenase
MSARTVTVLEVDQDLQTARHATRGILAAASHLPTAAAAALRARIEKVAATAIAHAAEVDRDSQFRQEAIAAARAERLLGITVPREFGGDGTYALGRACASTAMVYAMHQTKVACIVRHGQNSAWHQLLLRRLASEQLLLASSTTEGQSGGDVRYSSAPVERKGSRISLAREATVISYGRAADGIVTTARRSADAASSDQVLAQT